MQMKCVWCVHKDCVEVFGSVHAHKHFRSRHPQQALVARRTLAPLLPAPASSLARQQGRHEVSLERQRVLSSN